MSVCCACGKDTNKSNDVTPTKSEASVTPTAEPTATPTTEPTATPTIEPEPTATPTAVLQGDPFSDGRKLTLENLPVVDGALALEPYMMRCSQSFSDFRSRT